MINIKMEKKNDKSASRIINKHMHKKDILKNSNGYCIFNEQKIEENACSTILENK